MIVKSPHLTPVEFGQPRRIPAKPAPSPAKSRLRTAIRSMHVPAWKVITGTLLAGLLGAVYLHHVFTTQGILRDVNRLHLEHEKALIRYNDLRFTYERMTGPADVYARAKALGMVDGGPADDIIILED